MKTSLNWLREYVDITISVEDLARRLTLGAAEVEEVVAIGAWDERVVVGQVLNVQPHPNADQVRLATVTTGALTQTVVCGAPNVAAGQRIAFGIEGATLTDGHTGKTMTLKRRNVRGFESAGMVLSERELGLSDNHEGILVLPEDAPLGTPLRDYLGDVVLETATWANRPDLLSVLGVAREVAALTGGRVREPDLAYPASGIPIAERVSVRIEAPDLCSRYVAALVENVRIGPSPAWMQDRLTKSGVRPINNVVDITNYVMLELGQPIHAFDFAHLRGGQIIVRRGIPGEPLTSLDGQPREVTDDMLLIADAERAVAVAGVIGGQNSEVTESTTTVLIEAGSWAAAGIRRTGQRLKIRTEASLRFEKGVSTLLPEMAARRAAQLLVQLASGTAAPGLVDVYPGREVRAPILVPAARLRQVLGIDVPSRRVVEVLTALGFAVEWVPPDGYTVTPPYWRTDVRIADDIAEEVIRIVGYDDLPSTTISGRVPPPLDQPLRELRERVRDLLVAAGMQEVMTYSLVSFELLARVLPAEELAIEPPLRVTNPLSSTHEYLRTTLRASLLETLARNLRRRDRAEVAIFEAARVYHPTAAALPEEEEMVVGVVAGRRADRWGQPLAEPLDFFDAKAYVEWLLRGLRVSLTFAPAQEFGFIPGRCAQLTAGDVIVGVLGQVDPQVLRAFDIEQDTFLFDLRLPPLLTLLPERIEYRPISRFEEVRRDLALLLDVDVPAGAVHATIAAAPRVVAVRPFDEYRGEGIPAGKRSVAFALSFQAPDSTLTDADVDKLIDRLLRQLAREYGAVRR